MKKQTDDTRRIQNLTKNLSMIGIQLESRINHQFYIRNAESKHMFSGTLRECEIYAQALEYAQYTEIPKAVPVEGVDLTNATLLIRSEGETDNSIPHLFAVVYPEKIASADDRNILRQGVDHPEYNDAWENVMAENPTITIKGKPHQLYVAQSGDLYAVPVQTI